MFSLGTSSSPSPPLWKVMKEREVDRDLIDIVREVYEKTKDRGSGGEGISEAFWIDRGLRQGCSRSLTLFAILISDKGHMQMTLCCWQKARRP